MDPCLILEITDADIVYVDRGFVECQCLLLGCTYTALSALTIFWRNRPGRLLTQTAAVFQRESTWAECSGRAQWHIRRRWSDVCQIAATQIRTTNRGRRDILALQIRAKSGRVCLWKRRLAKDCPLQQTNLITKRDHLQAFAFPSLFAVFVNILWR